MFWIITQDHINDGQVGTGQYKTRESIVAIRDPIARAAAVDRFTAEHPEFNYEFQLLDDDQDLYYVGRCVDLHDMDESRAFLPLDWSEAHAGCTTMKYRKVGEKKWEFL